jgi:hypothetical protein
MPAKADDKIEDGKMNAAVQAAVTIDRQTGIGS